ncbi:repetitive organellar protein [Halyomorpha halys]|uniref:repetitive organellar protein n=1 Tax=Halyomorpha halys TaxID=286706 RepID=UPI0006D4F34F|nr:uncharacterized protein LOC106686967 [Halyomorpha halys]
MRKIERAPQQAKKTPNRQVKPVVANSNTPSKKRTTKVAKPNKPATNAKPKTKKSKIGKERKGSLTDSDVQDQEASYQKRLEQFQQYMENKLEKIMDSDQIERQDAERIMKKFRSAMVQEQNASQEIIQSYGDQVQLNAMLNYSSDENEEEYRIIENEFKQLDDIIKQKNIPLDQEEQHRTDIKGHKIEIIQVKNKTTGKKNVQRVTRGKTTKDFQTNARTTRSIKENYTTRTDSTRPRDTTKPKGKTNDQKKEMSSFVKRNEYDAKMRNLKNEYPSENRRNYNKNESLMKMPKVPTTDESSDSDLLLNKINEMKKKIGTKKPNVPAKRKSERSTFQNTKSGEGKERQDVLMNLLGEENIRKTYMRLNKQAGKKNPIFR